MDTQEVIPAGLAILLIAGAFLVAWAWPSARDAMAALRSAVWRHTKFPRLRVVVEPQPDPDANPPTPVRFGEQDAKGSEGG